MREAFESLGLSDYANDYYETAAYLENQCYESLIFDRALGAFYNTKLQNETLTFKEATSK